VSFQDKSIKCRDCGHDFTFTASEQQFFAEKGFTNEPKRCPTCRRAKRDNSSSIPGGQRTW